MTQLWSVTRHMGSHSVTCYPTQLNAHHLHPSQTVDSLYLPRQGCHGNWGPAARPFWRTIAVAESYVRL